MPLYPTLEDLKVDQVIQQQEETFSAYSSGAGVNYKSFNNFEPSRSNVLNLYPDLHEFMGIELTKEVIATNMPEYLNPRNNFEQTAIQPSNNSNFVAPLSGNSIGLKRAQTNHGIREVILCKDSDKKVGIRVQSIDRGVFICLVVKDSPASMVGLRFGDQILQINGTLLAGFSVDQVHNLFKKAEQNNISVVVRDRPFERTVTLHKDSKGNVGFMFNNAKITTLVKDSSAARNGLLIDHYILEVDGQNIVGMKDKEITSIINNAGQIVTITILPKFIYNHMVKKLSTSWLRGKMDHSIPDL